MKRRITLMILALFMMLCFAACNSGTPSAPAAATPSAVSSAPGKTAATQAAATQAAPAAAKSVTLNIVNHVQYDFLQDLYKEFTALHPNITVDGKVGQHADTGVYTAILAAADCPDIVMLGSGAGRIMPLAQAGLIADLTDDYKTRGWEKRVNPTTIDAIKRTSKGKLYEVSNGMDVFTVKYYKSEFTKLGLKPPTTYQEFLGLMQSLKDAGKLPMALGVKDGVMGGHMISAFWQAIIGRDVVAELLYGNMPYTDDKVVKGAEEFYNMMKKGYINNDCAALSYAEATAVFASKKASTFLCLQGYLDQFIKDGLDINDIGSFVIPSLDPSLKNMPIAGLSQDWVLPKNAKDKEAAYAWLDFVLSDDYIKALIKLENKGSWNPGIGASIPQDPKLLSQIKHPLVRAAFESLESGFGYNCSPYLTGTLKTTYFESMQNMLTGAITPRKAMEQMQAAKKSQ